MYSAKHQKRLDMKITEVQPCNCGAVTLYFGDNVSNSLLPENAAQLNIEIPPATLNTSFHCNHCVNHYGLDLCACGSGEPTLECTAGFKECGKPYQTLGENVKLVGWK